MAFAQIETNFRTHHIAMSSVVVVLTDLTDANIGVDEIVETQRPFALKHNVSFGDLYAYYTVR
jgi:manganese peroxidase